MWKVISSLALLVALAGCRTPAYVGGEFSHLESNTALAGPPETFVHRERWVYFWGLIGTEEIDVPEMGGVFDIQREVADKFAENEHLVDLVVEAGTTPLGIVTSIFTIGIVSQREIEVRARRVTVNAP
ncbi:MAG TPA: hypothetical protein VFF73_12185 [Planctomycetota bacterium]|nr:hypothetical protein [Planctomycetota bacterium]